MLLRFFAIPLILTSLFSANLEASWSQGGLNGSYWDSDDTGRNSLSSSSDGSTDEDMALGDDDEENDPAVLNIPNGNKSKKREREVEEGAVVYDTEFADVEGNGMPQIYDLGSVTVAPGGRISRFDQTYMKIHKKDKRPRQTFEERFPDIREQYHGKIVMAHNAGADSAVLGNGLEKMYDQGLYPAQGQSPFRIRSVCTKERTKRDELRSRGHQITSPDPKEIIFNKGYFDKRKLKRHNRIDKKLIHETIEPYYEHISKSGTTILNTQQINWILDNCFNRTADKDTGRYHLLAKNRAACVKMTEDLYEEFENSGQEFTEFSQSVIDEIGDEDKSRSAINKVLADIARKNGPKFDMDSALKMYGLTFDGICATLNINWNSVCRDLRLNSNRGRHTAFYDAVMLMGLVHAQYHQGGYVDPDVVQDDAVKKLIFTSY